MAIVNKTIDTGKAMNAIAHSCSGLLASASDDLREKMSFMDFFDRDKVAHKSISGLSLIVLRGSNGELKKARRQFIENNIHFVDFTETMTGDTYKEQLERTSQVSSEELTYYCVAAFAEKDTLDPITKRLSLWK